LDVVALRIDSLFGHEGMIPMPTNLARHSAYLQTTGLTESGWRENRIEPLIERTEGGSRPLPTLYRHCILLIS